MQALVKIFFLLYLSLLISCSSSRHSSETLSLSDLKLDFKVEKKILKNGLTVVAIENRKLPLVSVYTFYKVGSRYEKKGITGSTHFLEHMMFKGAKKYKEGKFASVINGLGGNFNAYTTKDLTVYHEDLPRAALDKVFDLESDRMTHLLLAEEAYRKEKSVVLEERLLRYENDDKGKLRFISEQELFAGPYQIPVIGSVEDIKGLKRKQMQEYFKTFYSPNNAVLAVSGDFSTRELFELAEKYFGGIPKAKNLDKKKKLLERPHSWGKPKKKILLVKGRTRRPLFQMSFPSVPEGHNDSYALDILASWLSSQSSSVLQRRFVENTKPELSYLYSYNQTLDKAGLFIFGGQLNDSTQQKAFRGHLLGALKNFCAKKPSPRDLQKVKNQYLLGLTSGLQKNSSLAHFFGRNEVQTNNPQSYREELKKYAAITPAEVQNVCQKYLKRSKGLFVSIWDKNEFHWEEKK